MKHVKKMEITSGRQVMSSGAAAPARKFVEKENGDGSRGRRVERKAAEKSAASATIDMDLINDMVARTRRNFRERMK